MKKCILFVGVFVVIVLAFSGTALATSGHDICQDYVEHHCFTHQYSLADLKACLTDAGLFQYCGRDNWAKLCGLIRQIIAHGWPTTTTTAHTTTTCRTTTTAHKGGTGGSVGSTTTTSPPTTTTTYKDSGGKGHRQNSIATAWPLAALGFLAVPGLGGVNSWLRRRRQKPRS